MSLSAAESDCGKDNKPMMPVTKLRTEN